MGLAQGGGGDSLCQAVWEERCVELYGMLITMHC